MVWVEGEKIRRENAILKQRFAQVKPSAVPTLSVHILLFFHENLLVHLSCRNFTKIFPQM